MIAVRVSPDVVDALKEEAWRKRVKFSELARLALEEFAAKLAAETPKQEAA
jgi:hypothetical protein